jgi:hypothetical protein
MKFSSKLRSLIATRPTCQALNLIPGSSKNAESDARSKSPPKPCGLHSRSGFVKYDSYFANDSSLHSLAGNYASHPPIYASWMHAGKEGHPIGGRISLLAPPGT